MTKAEEFLAAADKIKRVQVRSVYCDESGTSIADAFMVVEKMRELGLNMSIQTSNPQRENITKVTFSNPEIGEDFIVVDPVASRAISLAAYRAVTEATK